MTVLSAKPEQKDLVLLKELIEAGKLVSVIDKRYGLSEVSEAVGYLEIGACQRKSSHQCRWKWLGVGTFGPATKYIQL